MHSAIFKKKQYPPLHPYAASHYSSSSSGQKFFTKFTQSCPTPANSILFSIICFSFLGDPILFAHNVHFHNELLVLKRWLSVKIYLHKIINKYCTQFFKVINYMIDMYNNICILTASRQWGSVGKYKPIKIGQQEL